LSLEDGDIVRVVVNAHATANGAPIINVFWYEVSELTGVISTPDDLKQAAGDAFITVVTPMSAIQPSAIVYDNAVLDNMTNLIDTATYIPSIPVTGTNGTVAEPTGMALSFKLVRTNRTTRNGSKRVGGITSGYVSNTTGSSLVGLPAIVAIEDAFSEPFDVVVGGGNSCVFNPVIVRRTTTGTPITVFQPVSACVYRGVGSQNTRKRLL